jgi:protein ImuB
MPLAEAMSLTERGKSSGPHVELHDIQADRTALEKLAVWCEQFSPMVGLHEMLDPPDRSADVLEVDPCDSLLLDITGTSALFGGEAKLARAAVHKLHCRGYAVQLAVADTPSAAWAVARYGPFVNIPLVKVGDESDDESGDEHGVEDGDEHGVAFPQSVFLVPPRDDLALDALPIEALRLAEPTCELLRCLGLVRVGAVRRLPRASLPARFGPLLLERLDRLTGHVREMIVPHRPPPPAEARCLLEHPAAQLATVEQAIDRLLETVACELTRRGQGAVQLECRLDGSGEPAVLRLALYRPTADRAHLAELIAMQLERRKLPGEVEGICVQVTAVAALVPRQGELFAESPRQHARELAMLVDRLGSYLGPECVVRPRLQAAAQPERAFRYVPAAGDKAREKEWGSKSRNRRRGKGRTRPKFSVFSFQFSAGEGVGEAAVQRTTDDGQRTKSTASQNEPASVEGSPRAVASALSRPLQLCSPPLLLEVVCVAPDGPPAVLRLGGRRRKVIRHWGPERIETAWWRGRSVRRDYYRVEDDTGHRCWVFRRLRDGKWFLHGQFL